MSSISSNHIPEHQLVNQLLAKDKSALSYLYDNYSQSLYGVISRIINDEDTSSEVLQDAFLKIWSNISSYDSNKGKLFTWMLNLSRNLAIDKLRSKEYKKGTKTDDISKSVYVKESSNNLDAKTDGIGVKDLLKQLNPDQELVVNLLYFRGYTQSEVAEEYDIPLGTVKTRLRSALIQLRKYIK
ncbi:MAG: sigma-70 family RNA polymerase sigma factor [Bacteroidota bacterium]|nr:sigma-70 family RNA polymerase sigma factor [Bacteroidota bacterium]